jgi:hypothetical protein
VELGVQEHVDAYAKGVFSDVASALQRMLALHRTTQIVWGEQDDDSIVPHEGFDLCWSLLLGFGQIDIPASWIDQAYVPQVVATGSIFEQQRVI